MNAMALDPSVVDLRQHSPFYFEIGIRIAHLFDTGGTMQRFNNALCEANVRRWNAILDHTNHIGSATGENEHTVLFVQRLTFAEEAIFNLVRANERTIKMALANFHKANGGVGSDEASRSKRRKVE